MLGHFYDPHNAVCVSYSLFWGLHTFQICNLPSLSAPLAQSPFSPFPQIEINVWHTHTHKQSQTYSRVFPWTKKIKKLIFVIFRLQCFPSLFTKLGLPGLLPTSPAAKCKSSKKNVYLLTLMVKKQSNMCGTLPDVETAPSYSEYFV